jgi:SAM-dependent methyltransferase
MSSDRKTVQVENWLYRNPHLYDQVYGVLADETASLILKEIGKSQSKRSGSVLDVGCGTGQLLRQLSPRYEKLVGVDVETEMLGYARERLPDAEFLLKDMRSLGDIGQFDLIVCVGSVLMYMHTNEDLFVALKNFRKCLKPEGKLFIGIWNCANLIGCKLNLPSTFAVNVEGISASASATYTITGPEQRLRRVRTWTTSDGHITEDRCDYRLIFPLELEFFLERAGFINMHAVALDQRPENQNRMFILAEAN